MKYTEDNIIGVEFIVGGGKHIILDYPKDNKKVLIARSGNLKVNNDWLKSTVASLLNSKGWEPISNSEIYDIY